MRFFFNKDNNKLCPVIFLKSRHSRRNKTHVAAGWGVGTWDDRYKSKQTSIFTIRVALLDSKETEGMPMRHHVQLIVLALLLSVECPQPNSVGGNGNAGSAMPFCNALLVVAP